MDDEDRTASLMTPAKLAQVKPRASATPSAWLDKMAGDAGHQHVSRLAELCAELQLQAAQRDFSPLAVDLARLADALRQLDFGLLQQKLGLLARLSGKSKGAVGEFAAQFERIDDALANVQARSKALHRDHGAQARHTEATLLEFHLEFRALEKIIDGASRWLSEMRTQLKARSAEAGGEAARLQVQQDAERCQLLVSRLKALRDLSTAAEESHEQAQAVAARRARLVQVLQDTVGARAMDWRHRIAPLADAAGDGETSSLNLEPPMDAHRELQLGIRQAGADCAQMQAHEKALSGTLQALGAQLRVMA